MTGQLLAIGAVAMFSLMAGYRWGASDIATAERQAAVIELEKADRRGDALALDAARRAYDMGKAAAEPLIVYRDRVRAAEPVIRTIIQKVPEYVYATCGSPVDSGAGSAGPVVARLSGGFRVLHDATADAANGKVGGDSAFPGDSAGDSGAPAPVDPATAAGVVFENYRRAGENAARLAACQQTLTSVKSVYDAAFAALEAAVHGE